MSGIIRVVAALIRDPGGRVLLVRKLGSQAFMQPGGKRDVGESDVGLIRTRFPICLTPLTRDHVLPLARSLQ